MNDKKTNYRFLFAGGGTGGHLFPAVAIAQQIKEMKPEAEILFIGTKSRIEGRVIPELGFRFKSIWIKGIARKFNLENILFPLKLFVSSVQSLVINFLFKPKVAIGSGGYVSGPAVWGASVIGAKVILLEQNSYPGLTTRLLERYADEIHISFDDSKKYLRRSDIIFNTGNPVRKDLGSITKSEAAKKFGLQDTKKTLLILGGSLGALSINDSVGNIVNKLEKSGIQTIWQTGKNYFENYKHFNSGVTKVFDFIKDMNLAYSASDLVLARAGATTIAELLVLGIPSILIPSPNVAENHQYHNAKSLSDQSAAILLEDDNLENELYDLVINTITDDKKLSTLKNNAVSLAKPDAANKIASNAIKYCESV